ncbi:MAG: hypothetical protein JNL54_22000 [Kineosporiaceae bacterium]|nr:hypothetical protein [Kineosporiaceae bacterium]
MFTHFALVRAWLATHLPARLKAHMHDDRGEIVQTAIIVGLFAAAAIIVVGILVAKAMSAANAVRTQ